MDPIHKEVRTAGPAKLMGCPLLAELVILEEVFTLHVQISLPDITVHLSQRSANRAIAVTDGTLLN